MAGASPNPSTGGVEFDFGVHDPLADGQTCVLEKPVEGAEEEHYCALRVHHDADHRCSCGHEWQRSEYDPW